MPALPKFDKDFNLTIQEAAKILKVSTKTLRRWESQGLIIPERTPGNQRRYNRLQLRNIGKTPIFAPVVKKIEKVEKIQEVGQISYETQTPVIESVKENPLLLAPRFPSKKNLFYVGGAILALVLTIAATRHSVVTNATSAVKDVFHRISEFRPITESSKQIAELRKTTSPSNGSILGDETLLNDFVFNVNVPALFAKEATVSGNLTAPNIVYSITAGTGITITGDKQTPTISAADTTGNLDFFSSLAVAGQTSIEAAGNNDEITFAAGSNVSITTDPATNKITINATDTQGLTGTIGVANGGTGLTSYNTGDILYASADNTLTALPVGTAGQILTVSGGIPSWQGTGGGSSCTGNCLIIDPAATQTVTPTVATATGLSIAQAPAGSVDIFSVVNNGASTKYFFIDSTGQVNINSDIIFSATTPSLAINNGETLNITDGTNTLFSLADNGSTGTLAVNTINASNIGAFTLTGNITGAGSPNLSGLGTVNGTSLNGGSFGGATVTGGSMSGGTLSGGTYTSTGATVLGNFVTTIGNGNSFSVSDGTNTIFTVSDAGTTSDLSGISSITLSGAASIGTSANTNLTLSANGTGDIVVTTDADSTFAVSNLTNCDSIDTDANGVLVCGVDSGGSATLQTVYDNDVNGGDVTAVLSSVDDSIILRNPVASGTDSGYIFSIDQLNTGAVNGINVNNAGTGTGTSYTLSNASGTRTAGINIDQTGAGTTTYGINITESAGTLTTGINIGSGLTTGINLNNNTLENIGAAGTDFSATGGLTLADSLLVSGGTVTVSGLSTGVVINSSGTLSSEAQLAVARGGTGASTLTANGVLIGNGTSAVSATTAGTNGQLFLGVTAGAPVFGSMSGDAVITNAGVLTIQPDAVALSTDTTGNYVATISNGNGISGSSSSEGGTPTIALGVLTADWNQTGAFDIALNNAASELKILESVGATFYGIFDVTDLSADRTYTFPNASGEVCLDSGNCASVGGGVTTAGGTANTLSKFTGAQTIGNASITDDGTTVGFSTNISTAFSGTENLTIASDLSTAGTLNVASIIGTPSSTNGATTGLLIQQANSANANPLDTAFTIDNADTNLVLPTAIAISNSGGGGYTNLLDTPTIDISGSGAISGAAGIVSSGTITFSGLSTGVVINSSGTLSSEAQLAVARGGTGVGTFTTNGVIYGNSTSALQVTSAGTGGQVLLANGSGVPTFTTIGSDATISSTGSLTISADAVALGTDTTGAYVSTITSGNGISATATGEASTPTINLGPLTGDWDQTGAFDISLNNAASELKILESVGATFFGIFDVTNLTADRTYTFPDATGTVCLDSGNCAGVGGGVTTSGGTANTLAKFTGTSTIGNASITDDGTTVGISTNLSGVFAGTENASFTSDLAGTVNVISLVTTPSATTGTTRGIFVQQASSANTNGLDTAFLIDNADADLALTTAINITNSGGGGYTNFLDTPSIDISGLGAISGATGIVSSGTITFSGISTGVVISSSGTLSSEAQLAVARGGTGAATLTSNGVLLGNGTSAVSATTAGANGQLLLGVTAGAPAFATMSSDATITNAGVLTISADAVALGTDTTGAFVSTITPGNGISGTGSGEASTPTIALGPLTGDWDQAGAFDILLHNASSELKIMESAGATFYGIFDVADLSADRTYTFPNATGVVCLDSGNCASAGGGVTTSGGTNNTLAKFTGAQTIGDASITDDGTTVGFTTALSAVFAATENASFTSDLAGSVNVLSLVTTPSGTSGTTRGIFVQQADSANTNGLDTGFLIDNADTNLALTTAINITNSGGGGYTNFLDTPSIDISGLGAISGATGIVSSGTITFSGLSTGVVINSSGTLSSEAQLAVARGGTGAATLTSNGVLLGNGTSAVSATTAGSNGQLLLGVTAGAPAFASMSGDATITNAGVLTISADAVALGTDTTGAYVSTITSGNGVSATATGEASTPTINLGPLTSNWDQTGAFDISLNNAASELKILESVGATFFGIFDVGNLTADRTYTFPDATGIVCLDSGNCASAGGGVTTSGGTNNTLAKFTGAQTIGDASITDDGTTVGFTTALSAVFAGTENASFTSDLVGSVNVLSLVTTPSGTSGTTRGIFVQQADSANANGLDTGFLVDNADTNLAIGTAINITNSGGGGYTNFLDTPSIDISGLGAISGATGIVSSGTITFSGLSTGVVINSSGTLSSEAQLAVARGGTGAATLTSNGVLLGNGTSAVSATTAGSNGQLLLGVTAGAPAFASMSGDATITNAGVLTIAADAVALGTDTTGNYVATITNGNGISGSSSSEGGTPTIALGPLTGNWDQTGAFDISLNNAASELKILESTGATFFGIFDVTDLTADRTYTFPDATGTVCLSTGNCAGSGGGVTTSGGTNNTLAKFTGAQTIGDASITDDGTTVGISTNLSGVFAGTENASFTSDLAGTVNVISLITTPSATTGTTKGIFIQQADSANTNGLDNAFVIDNADTNLVVGSAINITNSGGGGYTNLLDTPTIDISGSGAISGAAGIVSSGTITFSGLSTGVVINSSGTLSSEAQLAVARGGTGAATLTSNGVLLGNGTSAVSATTAGTNGQLFLGVTSSAPAFATMSGDATITNAGVLTIAADAVALGTDTTGNYVATLTSGNGISATATGEGSTPTIALGVLTGNWDQTGAFDISLNNAASELKILESSGATFFGIFDVTDLTADRTYTFPDATGTVCLTTGNCSGSGGGVTTSGGTTNTIAKFSGAQTLADSSITDDATTVAIASNVNFALTSGTFAQTYSPAGNVATANGATFSPVFNLDATDQTLSTIYVDATTSTNLDSGDTLYAFNAGNLTTSSATETAIRVGSGWDNAFEFEGATNDGIETYFQIADPTTSDKVITVPDLSGTICLSSGNCAGGAGGSKWTDSGSLTYLTDSTDSVTIGSTSELGKLAIDGDADEIQLLVQGNGTQTSSLAVFEQSTGTDVFTIANNGDIVAAGSAQATAVTATTGNVAITTGNLTLGGGTTRISNAGVGTLITGTVIGSQTFTTNNIADSGALTIKSATSNALTLDSGTTGAVNIGTGASGKTINIATDNSNADTINIGSALDTVAVLGTTSVTGATSINTSGSAATNIGTGTSTSAITLGRTTGTNLILNDADWNISGAGAANFASIGAATPGTAAFTTLDASSTVTFSSLSTGVVINSSGVLSSESQLAVARGGTGAATLTSNGVLIGNGTSAVSATTAGSNGQLLLGVTAGAPAFATMSSDATITNAGVLTISANAVALTTDTTGNYVATITNGNGISGSSSTEGGTPTIALGPLTGDWDQTGAFDISLNNAASELKILESVGATFFGIFDVGNLTADRTYTFPDATGIVCLDSGNCASAGGGVTTVGGTNNTLAKFTGSQTIGNASITDDGTTVGISTNLAGVFAATENASFTSDLAGTVNVLSLVTTPSATTGTTKGIFVQQANSANTNGLDTAFAIDNADTNLAIATAINITNSGGGDFTTLLDSPTLDISGAGAITGAAGIVSSGTITFSGLSTGVVINSSGTLSSEAQLAVARGGTGAATLTSNGVLLGNGTSAVSATTAGSNGQLLLGVTAGAPAFATMSSDATITNAGVLTISADAVALGTDTTGNYVATITNGNGISGSSSTEGGTPTIALGSLTGNWDQTGAFDISLNNASSELKILESAGATFFGILDIGNLSADRTYTFPDATGTVCLDTGNCAGAGTGVTTSGGTTNTLAKFTASQAIGDASITDDGTTVGFSTALSAVFAGTENASITSDLAGTLNVLSLVTTPSGTSGTTKGIFVQQADSANTNGLDTAFTIDNADTNLAIPTAISITNSGGGNYTTLLDTPTLDISAAGAITGAAGIVSSGTITFSGLSTGVVINSSGTLSSEAQLAVARGGTGAATLTSNGVLLGNGTSAVSATTAGTNGQLFLGVTAGAPAFATMSSDATITNAGVLTIAADAVALGTDTTGAYVSTITPGNGISGTGSGEGSTPTIALGALTGNWDQTGAFDISLNNASSELKILESSGATFFGIFDVTDLSGSDKTYTFPNATGTVCLDTGNCASVGGGVTTSGGTNNTLAKFTGSQTIGDASITDDGTTVGFSTALSAVFAGTENASITSDLAGSVNVLSLVTTPSGTSGTTRGIFIQQADSANTNGLDTGLLLDNADTNLAIGTAINITNSGGGNYTTLLDTPTIDISGSGAITGAAGIVSSGTITFSGLSTGVVINSSGTLSSEAQLAVARGGTGAATLTSNGVLIGNGTSAVTATTAGTDGQLFLGITSGAPAFATMSSDATITNAGVLTISANAVALTTDTTGNYVATITNGNGISGSSSSEGGTPTIALGPLTGNWDQTGAFDISLNNAASELKILESSGATFFGIFDVTDLSGSDKTYTFPNATGTVCLDTGNCASSGGGVTTVGGTNNTLAKFTGAQTIGDASITDDGTTVGISTNLSAVLAGTENVAITSDIATAGTLNVASIVATPSSTNGTITGLLVQQADSANANPLDTAFKIDNADTNLALPTAISITNSGGGGYTNLLDTPTIDIAGSGAITGAAGIVSSGTITFSGLSTGVVINSSGTLSSEAQLAVARGGTGAATLTSNGVLLGNGTSAISATTPGTNGQLFLGVSSSAPVFATMGGDATITNSGTLAIAADAVALGTDTTGNYVATITNGSGISGSSSTEGGTPTIALGALTGNWDQTGAFDISLNNAASELKILESTGATFFGIFDVTDLAADRTYTFPDATGTVCLTTGNCASVGGGVTTSGGSTNVLAKFTGSQTIGDSSISDDGTTVSIAANKNLALADGTGTLAQTYSPLGTTGTANGATFTPKFTLDATDQALSAIYVNPNTNSNNDTGDTLYGLNIANITGSSATETAIALGTGWDNLLTYNGTPIINGSGQVISTQINGTLFTASSDGGSSTIVQADTLALAGGTNGIDTTNSGDTFTINLDTTEITDATFAAGAAPFTWTFNASGGTDTTIAFGNNTQTFTTGTATFSGNETIQGTTGVSLTGAGSGVTFENSESIKNGTNGTITLGRNDAGTVILNAADNDATAALTINSGGAAALTLDTGGSAALSIGAANASAITIGSGGVTTTNSGNLTVSQTLTGNGTVALGDGGDTITLSATTIALTANGAGNDITANLVDNNTDALDIQEGSNNYLNINTTNSSETMAFGNATTNPTFLFLGSGKVGMGGVTPITPLDVAVTSNATESNISTVSTAGGISVSSTYTSGNYVPLLQWYTTDNNATKTKVSIDATGNDANGSALNISTSSAFANGATRVSGSFCYFGTVGLGKVCDPTVSLSIGTGNQTTGAFINMAPTSTATGNTVGLQLDLSAMTVTGRSQSGFVAALPAVTNTGASTYTYKGAYLSQGAVVQNTAAGTTNSYGVDILNPNITQTTGTVLADAVHAANGTITTGGTQNIFHAVATGVGAGALNGVLIDGITPSSGTETAVNVGSGWDTILGGTTAGTNLISFTNFSVTTAGLGTFGSTLSVSGNSIGLNDDASANNTLSFGAGAGQPTGDLYWGSRLLCTAASTNCGWSASGGSSPWATTSNVVNLNTGTDNVTVGSATNLGKLAVDGDTDEIQLLIQGNGTQTSSLAVFENSGGTDQFTISNAGDVVATGDLTVTGGDIVSAATTNLLNVTSTAINFAGAATSLNVADSTTTKTIDIGGVDASGTDTINIATNGTAADVLTIGNSNASTTLALTGGDDWSVSTTGLITSSGGLNITAGNISLADTTGTTWSITNAGVANFGASATIAGTGDGTDALVLTLGDINIANGDLDVAGGDFNVVLDAADGVNITKGAAPTADVFTINGGTSTTSGVDTLQLTQTVSNTSGNVLDVTPVYTTNANGTFNIMDLDAFTATADDSAGTTVTGTVRGLNIGALTESVGTADVITSAAINIGAGWDSALTVNGVSVVTSAGAVPSTVVSGTLFSSAGDTGTSTIAQSQTLTIAGGNGLVSTDNTTRTISLAVGAGNGISVAADSVAVNQAFDFTFTGNDAFTPTSTGDHTINGDADSNSQFISTIASDVTLNMVDLSMSATGTGTTNTLNILGVTNVAASGTTSPDNLVYLNQADTDETVTNGIFIENTGAGTLTNGINIAETAGTITTGINLGANMTTGIDANANTIVNIGNAGTDFDSSGGLTLASTLTLTNNTITCTGCVETTDILNDTITATDLNATLTFANADFVDLASITHGSTASMGLRLPQATSFSNPASGEGYLAYDTDDNKLYVYKDVGGWTDVSGASTTLQQAYTADGDGGDAIITLDATDGSLVVKPIAGTNFQVAAVTSAPTTDMVAFTNAGLGTTTDGVDLLSLNFVTGDGSNATNTALNIAVTPGGTASGDIVNGVNIANITATSSTETGLLIGTGWDTLVSLTPSIGSEAIDITPTAGIRTTAAIDFNETNTTGAVPSIQWDSAETRGGLLDANLTGALATENFIDLTASAAFTSNLLDVNLTAASSGNVIDITTASNASSGNLIDLNFGNIADTGDAINISMGAAAVGAQGFVMTTSAGIRTASAIQLTENNTTGAVATFSYTDNSSATRGGFMDLNLTGALATENFIDVDTSSAWTSNLFDITSGAQAATGNYFDINVGNAAQTGDIFNADVAANAVALQTFVVTNAAAANTAGWLMDIDSSGAWTGNMFDITSGAQAATGNYFDINIGNAAQTGDVFNVDIPANAVALQRDVTTNAAASNTSGWLQQVTTSGAWTGNMVDITTGAQAWTGNMYDINVGAAASTGDIFNVSMGSSNLAGGAFVIADAGGARTDALVDISTASTGSAADAAAIFQINASGALNASANVMDFNISGGAASNIIDITTSASATSGNMIDLNMGSVADSGDAININIGSSSTTGQALVIANTAASTANQIDITADSLTTANILNVSADGLTSGSILYLESTSTSTTSPTNARLGYLNWAPGSATTLTGDLLKLNIGTNGNATNIFNITDADSTVFSVSEAQITSALPHQFTASGDVAIAYDINFTNQTASYIKSNASLTLQSGESFESNNLTLQTYGSGRTIFDVNGDANGGVLISNNPAAQTPLGMFMVSGTTSNNALSIFNETGGTRDILTASAAGTAVFTVGQSKIELGINSQANSILFFPRSAAPNSFGTNGMFAIGQVGASSAVNGRIWMRAGNANFRFQAATATLDYSEYLQQQETSEPGDVMILSDASRTSVKKANQPYDQEMIGVVSKYGTGHSPIDCWDETSCQMNRDEWANVGMLGQVYTKVSTENGPVKPGDPLTSSHVPGVAMKATKTGRIVGYALDHFDGTQSGTDFYGNEIYPTHSDIAHIEGHDLAVQVGKVVIFLQAGWYDPGAPAPDSLAQALITRGGNGEYGLVDNKGRVWDNVFVAKDGAFANLKVGSLKVDHIEGLSDLIAAAQPSGTPTPTGAPTNQTILYSLRVDQSVEIGIDLKVLGNLAVNGTLNVLGASTFAGDVNFAGVPTFNKDTAGFATVPTGVRKVEVIFDKEYAQTPIITANPTWDATTDQLATAESLDMTLLPQQDYIVAAATTKGFTLLLEQPAVIDLKFNWTAISVKDAKTIAAPTLVPTPTLIPSPTPTLILTPTPTLVPTPTP